MVSPVNSKNFLRRHLSVFSALPNNITSTAFIAFYCVFGSGGSTNLFSLTSITPSINIYNEKVVHVNVYFLLRNVEQLKKHYIIIKHNFYFLFN